MLRKLKEKCGITIVQGMKGYDVFSLSKMNILSLNCVKNLHEFMRMKHSTPADSDVLSEFFVQKMLRVHSVEMEDYHGKRS